MNTPPRVLMIDDDARYCELVGRKLSGLCDVVFAHTLSDGVLQMVKREPDAVLLDLSLPDSDENHDKTLARVKLHRNHAAIVILSANRDPDTIYAMIKGNASGYLEKDKDDQDGKRMVCEIQKAIASQRFCTTIAQASKKL